METRWRRLTHPKTVLAGMTVVYGLAGGLAGTVMIADDRAECLARAEAVTSDMVRLLDEHTSRVLDSADLVAARLGDRLGAADSQASAAEMLRSVPYLANLYLLDPAGRVLVDGRQALGRGADLSHLSWVGALADGKAATVGKVARDESGHAYAFAVARRVTAASGQLAGYAAALVDVAYFKEFYARVATGPMPALGVQRLDGSVLVRQPMRADDMRGGHSAGPGLPSWPPAMGEGTYLGEAGEDGVPRITSYRLLPDRGLVAWASLDVQDALLGWQWRAVRTAALVALGLLALGGMTLLLLRRVEGEERALAALETANRELRQSNGDLEQFAYVASHDLKEPLRNIASYVQLLQRRYEGRLDPDADVFIGYAVDGVRRMQAVIQALLAYSRVGTTPLAAEPVQAGAGVSMALGQLKSAIAEAQAVVEVKGPLPVVRADPAQLASLFQNLIGNGLKYRRPDQRPEIVIAAEDRGGEWEFSVSDNGIGIDPAYHLQIFDMFKRLHGRDTYGGTGIGLATCKRVVERHGGRIWVDSTPGRGATFRFTLPKA